MIKIIDPHIHLFDITLGQYHWLAPENPPHWPDKAQIARSFGQQDLALTGEFALAGFVHIEAGFDNEQPWRELDFLTKHCTLPFKAIAYIDISQERASFNATLTQLTSYDCFQGVRYILEDVCDDFLSLPHIQQNLLALAEQNILFEVQFALDNPLLTQALLNVLTLAPTFKLVINHCGFYPINKTGQRIWYHNLKQLSAFENVYIKCSGLEMADPKNRKIDANLLTEIINKCVKIFSTKRVMLASNFPLTTLVMSYQSYWQALHDTLTNDKTLWYQLSFENARQLYQLPISSLNVN
ncbi:amidohydrolase family protein [Thalassotalea sp. LPB0316]|uniref:amidohydrolase family protein n=1 Tax=Thalassotalea sp. LPB0316 TaxID=2769490 RepID=UPI001867B98F|nr:amidohydrolase family protein [Thalassotalea sp. LPB0316]QOL27030.1 amidohydrolase family protein [Thalassotalea sp. LPB0316]